MFTQCTVLTEVYPSYRIIGHLHTAQERSNEYTVYVVFIQVSYHIKKKSKYKFSLLVLSPLCSTVPADIPRSYCPCLELSPLILYLLTSQDHLVPASNYPHYTVPADIPRSYCTCLELSPLYCTKCIAEWYTGLRYTD